MTSKTTDDEDEEENDDMEFQFSRLPLLISGNSGTRGDAVLNGSGFSGLNRSPSPAVLGQNFADVAPLVRSTSMGKSSVPVRSTTSGVPQGRPSSRTPFNVGATIEPPSIRLEENRFMPNGELGLRDPGNQHVSSALQDELDMLQEENELILNKLRLVEAQHPETEARVREVEKQVASLGEGVSLEAKLLSRKEAALQQREAALKAAEQAKDGRDEERAALCAELENLKQEMAATAEQVREAETEAKALRTMTQRMILTHEEMEEVVLKRCWLARYWGLASHYGICTDISMSKHDYWSSFSPLPYEVVISAGQKAREDAWDGLSLFL